MFEEPQECLRCFLFFLLRIIIFIKFFLPQYGNSVGKGEFRGKVNPTYVYPEALKEAVRLLVQENVRDYPNPETPVVRLNTFIFSL